MAKICLSGIIMLRISSEREDFVLRYQRLMLVVLMVFTLIVTTGCVKGEILMEIGRTGSATLNTKILVPAVLKENLSLLKSKFAQDQFKVIDIKENNLEGFRAVRTFDNISQMREISVFRKIELPKSQKSSVKVENEKQIAGKELEKNPDKANLETVVKKPQVTVERGFLFDKYKVDLVVDLRTGDKIAPKEENWLIKNLLAQIDLKFILKLPTAIELSNANKVSEDGKTLVWNLILGEENHIVAETTMLNLKTAGFLFIGLMAVVGVGFYNYKKRK